MISIRGLIYGAAIFFLPIPASGQTTAPTSVPSPSVPEENKTPGVKADSALFSSLGERILNDLKLPPPGNEKATLDFPGFFPREPFLLLKNLPKAGSYYDELTSHYALDLTALRKTLPALDAASIKTFTRGFCKWKTIGSEYNHIAYWSCYNSKLTLTWIGEKEVKKVVIVRTVINWGKEWYVTHLGHKLEG